MSWENYGVRGWHVDHIIPCAFFDMLDEHHQRLCFNWVNLRPLWGRDNWTRRDGWREEDLDLLPDEYIQRVRAAGIKV